MAKLLISHELGTCTKYFLIRRTPDECIAALPFACVACTRRPGRFAPRLVSRVESGSYFVHVP